MAGVIRCRKHGRQYNRFVSTKLKKYVIGDEFTYIQECVLQIEGLEVSFYSDIDTATKLGATNGNTEMTDTLEEFAEKKILTPICRGCFNDYLIKYPDAMNKKKD